MVGAKITDMEEIKKLQGITEIELSILKTFFKKNNIQPDDETTNVTIEKKDGHVTALHISGEDVKHISHELGDLTKLESLILYTTITGHKEIPESFKKLSYLHTLKIRGIALKEIPNIKLPSLKTLTLVKCKFTDFSSVLQNYPSLESINFEECPVAEIPEEINRLKNLRALNLKDSKIKAIPDNLYLCNNLEDIDFRNCGLKIISSKIGQLSKLKVLRLSKNKISELPDEIIACKELTILSVLENNLTKVPDLFQLINLKELYLQSNKLTQIDDRILSMKLDKLNYSNNPCSNFPSVDKLKGMVKDEPYRVFKSCDLTLQSMPGNKDYKQLAIESLKYILSDMNEHGSANASLYENKSISYFKKKLEELN